MTTNIFKYRKTTRKPKSVKTVQMEPERLRSNVGEICSIISTSMWPMISQNSLGQGHSKL